MEIDKSSHLTGYALIKNQLQAMLLKRSLSILRTWILQIIQIFIPISFLIVAILVGRIINVSKDLPKLPLSLDSYSNPVTLVQFDTANNYTKIYQDLLKNHKVAYTSNIAEKMLNLVSFCNL